LLDEIEAALAEKDTRIAELDALLSQTNEGYAECIATREDYRARIAELEAAGNLVVEWWLSEGMKLMDGAPYAMFRLRSALGEKE
jgi:hypothetical protein